jgi:hypothetical protein
MDILEHYEAQCCVIFSTLLTVHLLMQVMSFHVQDGDHFKHDTDLLMTSMDSDTGIPPMARQQRISCGSPEQ